MRILIAAAGATGGYFGGRLVQADRDVTFLIRPRHAEQVQDRLRPAGPGDEKTVPVATVTAENLDGTYDLIVVAVKTETLPPVMNQIAPAVGKRTIVLAFLNGMTHSKALNDRIKAARVLGGLATDRIRRIHQELSVPGIEVSIADDAVAAMWHKWAFITAAGVITCLMRSPIGNIVAVPGGEQFIRDVVAEVEWVAAVAGHPTPRPEHDAMVVMLTSPGSSFIFSLYRDGTAGLPHESEHLLETFVTASELGVNIPLIALALLHLRAHDHATT